ncbi:MFS transporter [Kineococcus sp. SYSU DK003]|uniref:MFS transporter n=1 Tax=Kineococcus sp. SYSU DK003 TaxID=3383124 RepID=UPI003D7D940F
MRPVTRRCGRLLVQGAFGGVGIVVARAVVRDVCDTDAAARTFSALVTITSVAPVVAPVAGGQLLHFTSWRGVFVVLALVGLALCLTVVSTLPETAPAVHRDGSEGVPPPVQVCCRTGGSSSSQPS